MAVKVCVWAAKVGLAVAVSVGSAVSVAVADTTGVCVSDGTQASINAFTEANEILSIFGPPSDVNAVISISFLPALKLAVTADSDHVVHAPVGGKGSPCACCMPFTLTAMSLSFTLPFAYLNENSSAWADAAVTKNISEDPVVFSRFAYPAPVKPACVFSKTPSKEHAFSA